MTTVTAPSRPGRSRSRRRALSGWLSVFPALAVVVPLIWLPLAVAVYHSFTAWDGFRSTWIGFGNYVAIFRDGDLWQMLRTNLVFFVSIPIILVICLAVAVLLHEHVPGWRFFRSVYYLPTILSAAVVGLLSRLLYLPDGLVNSVLQVVGLGQLSMSWLETVPTALAVLVLTYWWQTLGQGTLIFLAGLAAMPQEVVEAAQLDGAGWWRRLFKIVLPLQSPAVSYFMVTNVVYVFVGLFTLVYTITRGGPGFGTTPIDYGIYNAAFVTGDFGYASALSVILVIIVSLIAWVNLRRASRISIE